MALRDRPLDFFFFRFFGVAAWGALCTSEADAVDEENDEDDDDDVDDDEEEEEDSEDVDEEEDDVEEELEVAGWSVSLPSVAARDFSFCRRAK
jgi:hypothetical protein